MEDAITAGVCAVCDVVRGQTMPHRDASCGSAARSSAGRRQDRRKAGRWVSLKGRSCNVQQLLPARVLPATGAAGLV